MADEEQGLSESLRTTMREWLERIRHAQTHLEGVHGHVADALEGSGDEPTIPEDERRWFEQQLAVLGAAASGASDVGDELEWALDHETE